MLHFLKKKKKNSPYIIFILLVASVSAVEDGPIQEEPKGSRTNETEFGNSINDTSGSASDDETGTFSPKSKRSHKPSSSNGSRALEAAREFYSAKPYFQVLLLNSHMNSIMVRSHITYSYKIKFNEITLLINV